MNVLKSTLLLLVAGALLVMPANASAVEFDAAQYYADALVRMQSLPESPYVRYTLVATGNGVTVDIAKNPSGNVDITFSTGIGGGSASKPAQWDVTYSAASHASTVDLADGSQAITRMPLFDPTWAGAHDWISHGIRGNQSPAELPNGATPSPTDLPVLATVTAIVPSAYDITDGGDTTCPSGSVGHALRLQARIQPATHPLREAIVDNSSGLICELNFDVRGDGGVMGMTGSAQINFENVQDRWLATDGHVYMQIRLFGLGVKHSSIDFRRVDIKFAS